MLSYETKARILATANGPYGNNIKLGEHSDLTVGDNRAVVALIENATILPAKTLERLTELMDQAGENISDTLAILNTQQRKKAL
jgi:hypothetical protein